MRTQIIKVRDHGENTEPYEIMLYQTENAYCVQVKEYEPDCWYNKNNAIAYFNYFKKNKILIKE